MFDIQTVGSTVSTSTSGDQPHGQQWRDGSRRKILDAAIEILRERSHHGFTLEEVAAVARQTRRTIYNHFTDRDELYRKSREELLFSIGDCLPTWICLEAPMPVALTAFAESILGVLHGDTYEELLFSVVSTSRKHPWLAAAYSRHIVQPLLKTVEHYLNVKQADGLFHHTPAAAASQLVQMLQLVASPIRLEHGVREPPALSITDKADMVVRPFLACYGRV